MSHEVCSSGSDRARAQPQPDSEATSSITPSSQVIEMTGSSVPSSDCSTNVSHELTSTEISSTEISGKDNHTY